MCMSLKNAMQERSTGKRSKDFEDYMKISWEIGK